MDEKQHQILSTAKRLFEEQGIQQTSINDIARECKISKATFYKYFKSKETIISDILLLTEQEFLETVRGLHAEKAINGKEKLLRKIRLFWDFSYSRGVFGAYILDNFSGAERQNIMNVMKSGRNAIMEEYKISLRDAFGEGVEPIMGDLILCVEGIIREFIYLSYVHASRIDADVVTRYVCTVLEAVFEGRRDLPGMIDESLLYDSNSQRHQPLYEENFKQTLIRLQEKISRLSSDLEEGDKLQEAIVLIEQEANAKQYTSLLMDALLALLAREPELAELVAELEQQRTELMNVMGTTNKS
ncbi:TetR/AcrR family transcriptional regulator [Brevibacillus sp. B_LB10_24]|uniref:TetR/AcrR family transcriptional regulator n=1 Tax=Brevibacillus sp. B_LB10_24 TaxID=3380645 RepID=UPI0038B806A3